MERVVRSVSVDDVVVVDDDRQREYVAESSHDDEEHGHHAGDADRRHWLFHHRVEHLAAVHVRQARREHHVVVDEVVDARVREYLLHAPAMPPSTARLSLWEAACQQGRL